MRETTKYQQIVTLSCWNQDTPSPLHNSDTLYIIHRKLMFAVRNQAAQAKLAFSSVNNIVEGFYNPPLIHPY